MKIITNFLYFMSKTDKDIINNCSKATQSTRAASGLFVTITAIFAFFSGTYAISTIFRHVNVTSGESFLSFGGLLFSIFVGIVFAFLIGNIDREIVSSKTWKVALVRFPLAIILGVVMAYPLELRLMENRINKHLISMNDSENSLSQQKRDERLDALSLRENIILENIQNEKDEINKWSTRMHAEIWGINLIDCSGKAGDGPIYTEAKRNMELHQNNQVNAQKELEIFRTSYPLKLETINNEYKSNHRSQSFDFLSQMEALSEMKHKSIVVKMTAWGILLVLIILELTPALLKLISGFEKKTEYDLLMDGRLGINNSSISVYANKAINEIERDVSNTQNDYVINLKTLVRV